MNPHKSFLILGRFAFNQCNMNARAGSISIDDPLKISPGSSELSFALANHNTFVLAAILDQVSNAANL